MAHSQSWPHDIIKILAWKKKKLSCLDSLHFVLHPQINLTQLLSPVLCGRWEPNNTFLLHSFEKQQLDALLKKNQEKKKKHLKPPQKNKIKRIQSNYWLSEAIGYKTAKVRDRTHTHTKKMCNASMISEGTLCVRVAPRRSEVRVSGRTACRDSAFWSKSPLQAGCLLTQLLRSSLKDVPCKHRGERKAGLDRLG